MCFLKDKQNVFKMIYGRKQTVLYTSNFNFAVEYSKGMNNCDSCNSIQLPSSTSNKFSISNGANLFLVKFLLFLLFFIF